MLTPISSGCRSPDCASSPSTGPGGGPTCRCSNSPATSRGGEPIQVFNYGHNVRDFTYIEDVVEGVVRTLDHVATPDPDWRGAAPDPATSSAPYRLYNIGNHNPVGLLDYIAAIERAIGRKAKIELVAAQPGDVPETYADVEALKAATGFHPTTPLAEGVKRFIAWYREFYGV